MRKPTAEIMSKHVGMRELRQRQPVPDKSDCSSRDKEFVVETLWRSILARMAVLESAMLAAKISESRPNILGSLLQKSHTQIFQIGGKVYEKLQLKGYCASLKSKAQKGEDLVILDDEDRVILLAACINCAAEPFNRWMIELASVVTLAEVEAFIAEHKIVLDGAMNSADFRTILWGAVASYTKLTPGWGGGATPAVSSKKAGLAGLAKQTSTTAEGKSRK